MADAPPVIDRLQLKRIALAVGVPTDTTEQALLDPQSLVRPNKRGRILVTKVEEWLAPQLKSLDPPNKHCKQCKPPNKQCKTCKRRDDYGHTITLSGCVLGSTGAQVLAGCLQAPPLQPHDAMGGHGVTDLDLSGCGLGDTAIGAIAAAPMYWEQHEQRLAIHRHKFDHRVLASLSLRANNFGKGGLKAICHPAIGPKLRELDLSDNDIGTGGAMAILGAALHESRLCSLVLARCKIGSHGCLSLGATDLPDSLTALDLSGNRITRSAETANLTAKLDYDATGWAALCARLLLSSVDTLNLALVLQAIPTNDVTTDVSDKLRFRSNGMGVEGAAVLAEQGIGSWFQCKLRTLDLTDNLLRSAGAAALCATVADTPITQLLLGGNEISTSGVAGMAEAYAQATKLRGKLVGTEPIAVRELNLSGLKSGLGLKGEHQQAAIALLMAELPCLRFLTVNLGKYKAYTLCAEGADVCVRCGMGSEDASVVYAAVGEKACWCEDCSKAQQADAEQLAKERLAKAQTALQGAAAQVEADMDKDRVEIAKAILNAAEASVKLANDFVDRTKRRKGASDVVSALRLSGAGLAPADGLLIGAWLAQPMQATSVSRLEMSHNHLLSRVILQRADGVGTSDEAELLGLHEFAAALRSSAVQVLQMASCDIGPAAMKVIAEGLPRGLVELDVSANPLKAGGLAALGAELPRVDLTVLTMDLGKMKRTMRSDKAAMDLAGEELKPDDLRLLNGWLRMPTVQASLTQLELGRREVVKSKDQSTGEEDGGEDVVTVLGNRLLTRHGSGAEAGLHGIEALGLALPGLARLSMCSLYNTYVGPVALHRMLAPAFPSSLKVLDLSGNKLAAAGKAALALQLRRLALMKLRIDLGRHYTAVELVAAQVELKLSGLVLLPEDAIVVAGWLLSEQVQSECEHIDLSENRLVGRLMSGPEIPFNGTPFSGEVADKHLRPLDANNAMLNDNEWRDDIGHKWPDDKKKDVMARAYLGWAVQTVLETGTKEPDGNARLLATTDSSRGVGSCTCHWAVALEALCASVAALASLRELSLRGNGLGPLALTKLAVHGIGAYITTVDLSDNPLVSLDWQGNELKEDMGAVEGILRRALSMNLRAGILGLGKASPRLFDHGLYIDGMYRLGCSSLRLNGTACGPMVLDELLRLESTSVQVLELGRNAAFGRQGKQLLAAGLNGGMACPSLTTLVIDLGTKSDPEKQTVRLTSETTELDLAGHRLDSADAAVLGACLATGKLLCSLTALDLSQNPAIGESGKIALGAGLANPKAPTVQYGSFGLGRKCQHELALDANADEIDMKGNGLSLGDVALLAGCLSPKQRAGDLAMSCRVIEVDISDNGLGDRGVAPLLASVAPLEAARQQSVVDGLRAAAKAAKAAMVEKAGMMRVKPEVTPAEEAVQKRAKLDAQLEPLLLSLASGEVAGVGPPTLTIVDLAGNDLGVGGDSGFVQPDPEGPRLPCSGAVLGLCTALAGPKDKKARVERLSLAHNPGFSGASDRNVQALSAALPNAKVGWLDLSECGVGPAGGIALADAASERMFELVIHKNSLGKEGKAALGDAFPDSKYGERAARSAVEAEAMQLKREEAEEEQKLKALQKADAKRVKQKEREKMKQFVAEEKAMKEEARLQKVKDARLKKAESKADSRARKLKMNAEEAARAQLSLDERVEQIKAAMEALEKKAAQAAAGEEPMDEEEEDAEWDELEKTLTWSTALEATDNEVVREAQEKVAKHERERVENERTEAALHEKERRDREKVAEKSRVQEEAKRIAKVKRAAEAKQAKLREAKAEQKRWAPAIKANRAAAAAAHSDVCLLM